MKQTKLTRCAVLQNKFKYKKFTYLIIKTYPYNNLNLLNIHCFRMRQTKLTRCAVLQNKFKYKKFTHLIIKTYPYNNLNL